MSASRRNAAIAGVLYLVTHVASVGAVILYGGGVIPAVDELHSRENVLAAGLLEIVLAVAVVGTALALYPIIRLYGKGLAASYVALRGLEASVILVGVVAILPVVAAPETTNAPGLDADTAHALLLVHDWAFVIGPGLIAPVNTLVLAFLLLRNRLTPRAIPILGIVGAPLIAAANLAAMFGIAKQQPWAALPIFAWEVSLAVYLIACGLRLTAPSRIAVDRPVGVG